MAELSAICDPRSSAITWKPALSSAIKVPIAFAQCVQILTRETLRKKGEFYDFYKPTKIPYKALFLTHFKKEKGNWASYTL